MRQADIHEVLKGYTPATPADVHDAFTKTLGNLPGVKANPKRILRGWAMGLGAAVLVLLALSLSLNFTGVWTDSKIPVIPGQSAFVPLPGVAMPGDLPAMWIKVHSLRYDGNELIVVYSLEGEGLFTPYTPTPEELRQMSPIVGSTTVGDYLDPVEYTLVSNNLEQTDGWRSYAAGILAQTSDEGGVTLSDVKPRSYASNDKLLGSIRSSITSDAQADVLELDLCFTIYQSQFYQQDEQSYCQKTAIGTIVQHVTVAKEPILKRTAKGELLSGGYQVRANLNANSLFFSLKMEFNWYPSDISAFTLYDLDGNEMPVYLSYLINTRKETTYHALCLQELPDEFIIRCIPYTDIHGNISEPAFDEDILMTFLK